MKQRTISLRRRQLMIAGVAGVATPAAIFAGQSGVAAVFPGESADRGGLVLSGRILGMDGQPLSGATVEAWHDGARGASVLATTDGDGRFFTTIAEVSGRPRQIQYRVSHDEHTTQVAGLRNPALERDEAGTWRTTLGHALT